MKKHLRERLLQRTNVGGQDDCWPWRGPLNEDGYGTIWFGGKALKVHRAMLQLVLGRNLAEGECACHRCDNPSCINPRHLFVGSHLQNMRDCAKKGRSTRLVGSKDGNAKLTEYRVQQIRTRSAGGESYRSLAKEFGVTYGLIGHIVRRRLWRHVA